MFFRSLRNLARKVTKSSRAGAIRGKRSAKFQVEQLENRVVPTVSLVGDLNPFGDSNPADFTMFNGSLFFTADNGSDPGRTLWVTDGTPGGTIDLSAAFLYDVDNLVVSSADLTGDGIADPAVLFFTADDGGAFGFGNELYYVDSGLGVGVVDINPGLGSSFPHGFAHALNTQFGEGLYFGADDGTTGVELYSLDSFGLYNWDLNPAGSSNPTNMYGIDSSPGAYWGGYGMIFGQVDNGAGEGSEFFLTDGLNLQILYFNSGDDDENSGAGDGLPDNSLPGDWTMYNNSMFFTMNPGQNFPAGANEAIGFEMFAYDFTDNLSQFLIFEINPGDDDGDGIADPGFPYGLTVANNQLWLGSLPFTDQAFFGGFLLNWDGAAFNLVDANFDPADPGTLYSYDPTNLTEFNGSLFFDAFNANSSVNEGNELWFASDVATFGLVDPTMSAGAMSTFFSDLTVVNGSLYFWAVQNDGGGPAGAWVFDGVAAPQYCGDLAVANNFTLCPDGVTVVCAGDEGLGMGVELYTITPNIAPPGSPIADAGGPYTINEGDSLTLDASASTDPDFDPLTYSWDVNGDGIYGDVLGINPTLTWAQLQALFPSVNNGPATINVSVLVDDGNSTPDTDTVTLTVVNVAPTATVGNNGPQAEGSVVTATFSNQFDPSDTGIGNDTDFGFTYNYDFDGDGVYEIIGSGASFSTFTYTDNFDPTPESGGDNVVEINMQIVDQNGGTSTYQTTVTLTNANPSATLVALPNNVNEGDTSNVDVNNQQDPGVADLAAGLHYAYDFNNDGDFTDPGEIGNGTYAGSTATDNAAVPASFLDDGNAIVTVHVRVIDKDGGTADLTVDITVNNVDPQATAGNNGPVLEGATTASLTFSGQSDPSTADTAAGFHYAYDFNNDGVPEVGGLTYATGVTSATVNIPASFVSDGTQIKTMRMYIIDKDNGLTEYSTNITVNNVNPTAVVNNNGPKPEGVAVTVSFTGQADPSADDFANLRYSYDWNNDNDFVDAGEFVNITLASQTHVFPTNAVFTVHVQISDNDGGSTDYTTNVTVTNSDIVVVTKDIKTLDSTVIVRDAETNIDKFAPFQAFGVGYKTGVRVAVGDVNGDGVPDIICAPTKINLLTAPGIRVFDGTTGLPLAGVLGTGFNPFAATLYKKGFFVASADFNNDGKEDIVAGMDAKGSTVKVISGADGTTQLGADIVGFPLTYKGVRVATGDVTGDGKADIIATAGTGTKLGKESLVKVFDGVNFLPMPGILGAGINPFTGVLTFKSTLFVAAGDVNGDGKADIITAASKTGTEVRILNGLDGSQLSSFTGVADPLYKGGLRVATTDADGDGKADIIIGTGKAKTKAAFTRVVDGETFAEIDNYFAFGNTFLGGEYVAGGR